MNASDVIVIGAGPSGVIAALRAAELGARTTLVTRSEFGGMAANDGPVPVRTLAQAARLLRGARTLDRFGISVGTPVLDYSRLLERVRIVVEETRCHSAFRSEIDRLGVTLIEHAGDARFVDAHTIETQSGLQMQAEKIILCAGGTSRRLSVPGAELTATHSDAWALKEIPRSILVIGGGMTGAQVASIFHAFGSRILLFQRAARILPDEDEDVSTAVATAFRDAGMVVRESFGDIDSFERTSSGVRMNFSRGAEQESVHAELIVLAIGWVADVRGLNLPAAGVQTDARGYIAVDASQRTSTSHIFAAGDITGRWMLVPQAIQDGWVAATNAVRGTFEVLDNVVCPTGGFTDPEYASVGLTERQARESHDVVSAVVRFDATTRTIIDDRTAGFCKLLVERGTRQILGCHVVGERAVEIVQIVAVVMSSRLRVDELVRVPLSFPTYTGILARTAYRAVDQLGLPARWIPT
ncbi:dihydrolipoyl dehydrogenase family protein [Steroidobacter cummioxidans]|uniref:dihydrolipoyl dehydrogenase family protein n=1 Tax=Steroidobacter cummioxidans TaxID=1803913 RepID=UPI000E30CA66|nr:NAD(P)/FAD-dependent oxidoreductase [Steroidobacter cummioxidans]